VLRGFIQTPHELPDVGSAVVRPLAFGVGVANDDASRGPFEGLGRRPLRMLRREYLDAIEREGCT
jgi:hypothetical protein